MSFPTDSRGLQLRRVVGARFLQSQERKAQIAQNEISYSWDILIEKFANHLMTGTQYRGGEHPVREQEKAFRFMAQEPRTRRRMLAVSLHETLKNSLTRTPLAARVMTSNNEKFPYYVFLFLHRKPDLTDDEYRNMRIHLLSDYCQVAKLVYPKAKDIIGLASEAGLPDRRSEDLIYLNADTGPRKIKGWRKRNKML